MAFVDPKRIAYLLQEVYSAPKVFVRAAESPDGASFWFSNVLGLAEKRGEFQAITQAGCPDIFGNRDPLRL